MIVVSKGSLQGVASAITDALISAETSDGKQFIAPTLDHETLMRIALGAVTAASGDVVWPAGKEVEVHVEDRPRWLRMIYERRR